MTDQDKTERFYDIAETLSPGSEPVVIQREVEPDARLNECYSNCQSKVNKSGGAMQCGWVFHRGANYLVAISHAVWRSPEGVLIDITPMLPFEKLPEALPLLKDTEGHLVFLPDAKAFEAPNRYLPLSKNKALVRTCRRSNRREWQVRHNPELMVKRYFDLKRAAAAFTVQEKSICGERQ